jgi:hypothetical protein
MQFLMHSCSSKGDFILHLSSGLIMNASIRKKSGWARLGGGGWRRGGQTGRLEIGFPDTEKKPGTARDPGSKPDVRDPNSTNQKHTFSSNVKKYVRQNVCRT